MRKKIVDDETPPAPAKWPKFASVYPKVWDAAVLLVLERRVIHATDLWEVAPVNRFSQYDIGMLANELVTFGPCEWGAHRPTFSQNAFATLGPSAFIAPSVAPEQWNIVWGWP